MRGVMAYVSDPYSINDCTTSKLICPEVRASTSSLLSTLVSRAHFCRALRRLLTTYGQLLSTADRNLLRYLKDVTGDRGIP